jgi:hypothetical protein
MARIALVSASLVVAAVLVGCGPAKEYPSAPPREEVPREQPEVAPTTSQPAARTAFDKAVNAYTGGKPELLARGKVSRVTARGSGFFPAGNQKDWVPTVRHLQTVWPDRVQWTYDMKGNLNKPVTTWIRRPHVWLKDGTEMKDVPNPAAMERVALADVYAQHWLPLMLPALEPKAVVYDLQQAALAGNPVQTLKISLPEMPVYELTFDAKSHRLVRVEFTLSDYGQRIKTVVNLGDHKLTEGLLLPHGIESSRNGEPVEQWAVDRWEFPASIDEGEFSPPKK